MKEAPGSSETSFLTRATRRNNPEDTILHSHRRENLKSYIPQTVHALKTLKCDARATHVPISASTCAKIVCFPLLSIFDPLAEKFTLIDNKIWPL
jgi:hypothetical protein